MIKTPSNIKALIFDCDGTLVDTMPLHMEAWKTAFEMNGRNFHTILLIVLKELRYQK